MDKIIQDKALTTKVLGTTLCIYLSYKIILLLNQPKSLGSIKEIPVPRSSIPYFGHLFSLASSPSKAVTDWHNELGPIVKFRMGIQTWISIDDPRLAHKLLVTNGAKISHRPISEFGQNLYSIGGKGIVFAQPHSNWSKIRGALNTAIGPSRLHLHEDSIQNEAKKLVDRLLETTSQTGGVYPFEDLQLYVMNSIVLIGFGKVFKSKSDTGFIELSHLMDDGSLYGGMDYDLANYLPVLSIMDYFTSTKATMRDYVNKRRDPTFQQLIKEGLEASGPNLVKYLKENKYNLSEEETIVTLSDLILAGTETNSISLCWTIAILCHHPLAQIQASTEIDSFIQRHGRLPFFSERLELPFCISLLKECMRYRPAGLFGIPHECSEDVEVDGYVIPKGASVITNMSSMHKNPNFYPDRPNEFVPERYMSALGTSLAASNGKIEDRDHFNFGWGRRICPGIHMSEVEMFAALVEILSRCMIEPTVKDGLPDIDGSRHGGIFVLPLPYKVKFTKREIPLENTILSDPSLIHL